METTHAAPGHGVGELQQKLNEQALTRPEKVNAVRQALTDVKYPPDELLKGIAHLLGIHLERGKRLDF